MKIEIDQVEFEVVVAKKRIKNLIMRIKVPNQILISAPMFMSSKIIQEFIDSKKSWILETNQRVKKKEKRQIEIQGEHSMIQYFGKPTLLKLELSNKEGLVETNEGLVLKVKQLEKEAVIKTFESQAKKVLEKMTLELRVKNDAIMDDYHLAHPSITWRKMTSKWGSCIPSKAKITMNINLIYFPKECLEYVLLHEYAHMVVPNHSKRFYEVIEHHMPNYRNAQKILKER